MYQVPSPQAHSERLAVEDFASLPDPEPAAVISNSPLIRFVKRTIDVLGAMLFFLMFGWLFLVLWAGVIFTSKGPAIYSQPRYGKKGQLFKFYKFRSMMPDSEAILEAHLKNDAQARQQWKDFQKLEHDPRITKFGSFMRKTSLDELPQFWNVLIGDMSLIGPRPCMKAQKELYGDYWNYYCAVRPGITGLWQVSGRNKLTYQHRVALDVKYVQSLSIAKDISIALRTFLVVATGHGSR